MDQRVFRLTYVSRNLVTGSAAEMERTVDQILATSRRNNEAAGVTGALLFNHDCFAQVLEGDCGTVQTVFERIQCDPRHRQTVVLNAAFVPARAFATWSMAYAGRIDGPGLRFDALAGGTDAADAILDVLRGVVLRAETV